MMSASDQPRPSDITWTPASEHQFCAAELRLFTGPLLTHADVGLPHFREFSFDQKRTCKATQKTQVTLTASFDWLSRMYTRSLDSDPEDVRNRQKKHTTIWTLRFNDESGGDSGMIFQSDPIHTNISYSLQKPKSTNVCNYSMQKTKKKRMAPGTVSVKFAPKLPESWIDLPGWESCKAICLTDFKSDGGEPVSDEKELTVDMTRSATLHWEIFNRSILGDQGDDRDDLMITEQWMRETEDAMMVSPAELTAFLEAGYTPSWLTADL